MEWGGGGSGKKGEGATVVSMLKKNLLNKKKEFGGRTKRHASSTESEHDTYNWGTSEVSIHPLSDSIILVPYILSIGNVHLLMQ